MRIVVDIDLEEADLALFDAYEAKVLPLLAEYGARLELRLRAKDASKATHVLHFPGAEAREA